jgi:hypothetical protein
MAKSVVQDLEMAAPRIEGESQQRAVREIVSIGKKFDARRERIEGDPNLSETGKRAAMLGARQEIEAELSLWSSEKVGRLDDAIVNRSKEVERVASPSLPADPDDYMGVKAALRESRRESRASEIRRPLDGSDPLEVEGVYFNPSTSEEVRAALESAPHRIRRTKDGLVSEPWISTEAIARQRMGRAAATRPELVAELRGLQEARADYSRFGSMLGSALRREVPTVGSEIRLHNLAGEDASVKR